MNRTLADSRTLRTLTLTALVGATGVLALLVAKSVIPGSELVHRLSYLFLFAMLLVTAAINAMFAIGLKAAAGARRDPAAPLDAVDADPAAPRQVSRRDVLKYVTVEAVMGSAALITLGYIVTGEARWLKVDEVEVPITGLPSRLDGLRIIQLSDLHLSKEVPLKHIQQAVAMAHKLAGDLIVITGDFVTDQGDDARACASALSELRAPLGVHTVLGNRDYNAGASRVANALATVGLAPLRNQGRAISRDGGERADFWLAGLDDVRWRRDNLDAALRGAPAGVPVILMVHEPDYAVRIAERAADLGIVLQLSGHSHGGQVRLPFIGAPVLPRLGEIYPLGLQKAGQMWVYTTRGVGVTFPPIRFNCPPEITALTLRRV